MEYFRKIRKIIWEMSIGRFLMASKHHFTKKIDAEWKSRLKNHDFTIIAPNCSAGLIYHRLGHKFLSPTINLWFEDSHYLKFCQNLRYYLQLPLQFIIDSNVNYPIAMCGDVKIYFNHYKTKEEALYKWDERKRRVNWDNLYLIGDDRRLKNKEMIQQFLMIPCRNHIVFTSKNYQLKGTKQFSAYSGLEHVGFYVIDENRFTGLRCYEKEFDIVDWLNSKKE